MKLDYIGCKNCCEENTESTQLYSITKLFFDNFFSNNSSFLKECLFISKIDNVNATCTKLKKVLPSHLLGWKCGSKTNKHKKCLLGTLR